MAAALKSHALPAYDSFHKDKALCRHLLGCLFKQDVELYAKTCAAPWVRGRPALEGVCAQEKARWRGVCGLDPRVWKSKVT